MESENFGHQHPLVLLCAAGQGQGQGQSCSSSESEEAHCCSRCGQDLVGEPCYKCAEDCGFYLHKHKECNAPSQLNHPFHRKHPLLLLPTLPTTPLPSKYQDNWYCNFCRIICERFVYHCSCNLVFHAKCALLLYDIANKSFNKHQNVDLLENTNIEVIRRSRYFEPCWACREPLADPLYLFDRRFHLHKKCVELPLQISHALHRKHPLTLQLNIERLSCPICEQKPTDGLVYCCPSCKFGVHIKCVAESPLPTIIDGDEMSRHSHQFTRFQRPIPFTCDACGTKGNCIAYICSDCNIMVHQRCTSLPRIIRSRWHDHRIFHKYFIRREEEEDNSETWDCLICHHEVNTEHGSYSCPDCKVIFHVNCVKKYLYEEVVDEQSDEDADEPSFICVKRNDAGEATEIIHAEHGISGHNLMLISDKTVVLANHQYEYDDKWCDGCLLPILLPFYYCSLCDFSLHKACAELPKKKKFWFHECKEPLILHNNADGFFLCSTCGKQCNGFGYKCWSCEAQECLQCVIALTPGALTCPAHKHSLFVYDDDVDDIYDGRCVGCNQNINLEIPFRCKDDACQFALCFTCFYLPIRARHRCDDEHLLALTYHDDSDYSKHHYCDMCEEERDPNNWFYYCATCDTAAHPRCALGDYPCIKLGSMLMLTIHPHPLTFVKKSYYYPKCRECGEPCQDLALECATSGCNHIVHWKCTSPRILIFEGKIC